MAKGTIKTRGTRGGNKNASQLWSGKPTTTQLNSFQQKVQAFDWPQFQQLQQQYHQKETEFNSIILQGMQLGLHTHTMLAQIGQTGRGANKSTRNTSTKRSQAGQKGGRASARARGPNQQSGSLSATG